MTTAVTAGAIASARDLVKVYGVGTTHGAGARRGRRRPRARRAHGDHGTVRAPASRRSCTAWRAWTGRRPGTVVVDGETVSSMSERRLTPLRRTRVGLRVPGLQPRADADRAGEHHAAARHRAPARRPGAPRPRRRDPRAGGPARATSPASSPAGSSSGWRARGRSSRARRSCSPTSRRATSTARSAAEVLGFLRRSVDDLGQSVVMVTHDPTSAGYAHRVLFLADGRLVGELRDPTRGVGARPR